MRPGEAVAARSHWRRAPESAYTLNDFAARLFR